MGVPVGDILRSFVPANSWLGRLLARLKGISINVKGTEINLNKGPGPSSKPGPFDRPGGLGR